jgi:serine/threonine protein kinase
MIGTRLGAWVIDAEIGSGAMGRVFRAHRVPGSADAKSSSSPEPESRNPEPEVAAVKVLAAELARDPVFAGRFQREIEALGQLHHPNIVRFFESGVHEGVPYYVMEYVDGPDCERILRERGRLPWPEVLAIALQVVPALKHAHDRGVIHRDLKPSNIMLSGRGDQDPDPKPETRNPIVKLTDFGIAKVFARPALTATGSIVGTAAYLAPEQAVGKPATKRTDFYALGGVLYALLTGRPPFPGDNVVELMHKHVNALPERPARLIPELPHDLDALVCQLLEKDPARRPADGMVLIRQLERIRGKLERRAQHDGTTGRRDDGTTDDPTPSMPSPIGLEGEGVLPSSSPGPATLMARLMRGELESQNRGGPVARLFNHPVTLVGAFVLCVALIAYGIARPRPSAEELFHQAEPLMASDRPFDWERAWDEYLEPMTRKYPDNPYQAQVAELRQRIDDHAARDRALARLKAQGPLSEAGRFYQQGLQQCQAGDAVSARRTWRDVVRAFAAVPAEARWVKLAEQGLADLDRLTLAQPTRWEPVRQALAEARRLRDAGRADEAARIWQALEELYRDDPTAGEVLAELRRDRTE